MSPRPSNTTNDPNHPASPDVKTPSTPSNFNYDQLLQDLHSGDTNLSEYMYFMRQQRHIERGDFEREREGDGIRVGIGGTGVNKDNTDAGCEDGIDCTNERDLHINTPEPQNSLLTFSTPHTNIPQKTPPKAKEPTTSPPPLQSNINITNNIPTTPKTSIQTSINTHNVLSLTTVSQSGKSSSATGDTEQSTIFPTLFSTISDDLLEKEVIEKELPTDDPLLFNNEQILFYEGKLFERRGGEWVRMGTIGVWIVAESITVVKEEVVGIGGVVCHADDDHKKAEENEEV